jgi:UPF0755 protein
VNEKSTSKKYVLSVAGGFAALIIFFLGFVFFFPNSFSPSPQFVTVSKGQSFSSLADSLEKKEIIFSAVTFKIAGRLLNYTQKMRVGKYSFVSGVSNFELLNDLEGGLSTVSLSVTLREGVRAKTFARILKHNVGIDSARFMHIFTDTSLIGIYPNKAPSLEGYLMPNTYNFYWQDDERAIIQRMITEFREFFVDSLQQRMKQLGYNLNDVMTMASIVEGEAVHDDERAIIAGVYYNRLKRKMMLQADPTVLYAVSDGPKRLTKSDLKFESDYNTYLNFGLPPGPINNPGKQSIIAALYPAKHNYLYFVADNNGRHRFAKNYLQHQRNVVLYRKAKAFAKNGG